MKKAGAMKRLKIAGGLFAFFLAIVAWQLSQSSYLTADTLVAFSQRHDISAPVIFVLVHILFAAFFIPCSPLTILSGIVWGQAYGLTYSMLGALGGSCFTFLAGRYFARRYVRDQLDKSAISWVMGKADKLGWEIVAFTQINPVFPASTLGYLYGLTSIRFRIYFLTTLLSMLPLQIAFVSMGSSVRNTLLFGDLEGIRGPVLMMVLSFFVLFILKPLTKSLVEKTRGNDGRHIPKDGK